MAKVYKRKLPSGNISWIADYTDPFTGNRRRESFAKKKLADAKIEEITYRKIRGEPVDSGKALKTTLGEMIDDYRDKCLLKEGEASFNRNRRFALERFENQFGRPTLVASIQYRHIEDYRDKLIDTPTAKGAKRAGASVNREMTQIRRMFRKSKKRGFVLRNPFKDDDGDLRLPEAKRDRYWTKDEFETLLAECADHLRPIVFTAVASGLRRGNLLALTWDMVDFDRGCIGLPEGMMKSDQALNVPITYSLKHVLKAIRKSQLNT